MTSRIGLIFILGAVVLSADNVALGQDFDLEAGGTCPGRISIRWKGAPSDVYLAVCYSSLLGSYTLPAGPCCGTVLGLSSRQLQLIRTVRSGSTGTGHASGQADPSRCGGFLQRVAFTGYYDCPVSNVAALP